MKTTRPKLKESEESEPYAGYYYRESAEIPPEVMASIQKGPYSPALALPFENINDLMNPGYLPLETGYCHMPDGSIFVAVKTDMPNVTGHMLDWWFWWHPMHSLRYKIWYPESHLGVSLDRSLPEYLSRKGSYAERYWNVTNYPREDVGIGTDVLSIKFVPPSDFGFDVSRFEKADVATVVCGIVGSVTKRVKQHTLICHFVRRKGSGVEMRSRFWIGKEILMKDLPEKFFIHRLINTRAARRIFMPRKAGLAMARHCAQEYNNLASILHQLYIDYS